MASRASIAGHPIHPMLVVFPIALWIFSFVSDLIYLGGGSPSWHDAAFYTMAGGVIGGIAAAIPGAIDLFSTHDRDIRRIGSMHMTLNLTIGGLFIINLWWRSQTGPDNAGPVWLSLAAIVLLGIAGWLGGEMVYIYGAGVAPEGLVREQGVARIERRRPFQSGEPYLGPERRAVVQARRND